MKHPPHFTHVFGHGSTGVASTRDLQARVNEYLDRQIRLAHDDFRQDEEGILYALVSELQALIGDPGWDRAARRLYGIRFLETDATNFYEIGDPLTQILNGYSGTDIPVVPSTLSNASEMVEAYCDARSVEMNDLEQQRLAHMLHRFAIGYIYAETLMDEEQWVEEEAGTEAVAV